MTTQCYHDGDFWQCKAATSAGESPTTTPAKWVRQTIPAQFRRYLVLAAAAKILPGEGKTDLARAVTKEAESIAIGMVATHSLSDQNDAAATAEVRTR